MNKYTLSFTDKAFETLYQNQIEKSYSTMSYSIILGLICALGILIIQNLVKDLQISQLTILYAIAIVYYICQFLILRKYQKWQVFAILSNNIIVMTATFNITNQDSNNAFFMGQSLMCFHSICLFVLDFKLATFMNIILLFWRIIILALNVETMYYPQLLSAIFIQFILMVCLYIKCKAQRELHLLCMKDQNIERLLPDIVSKPMFIFTFDKENLKFLPQLSVSMEFLKDIENPLQHLLRHTQYLGNTLEHYIFRKFRSYDSEAVEETEILRVKYQKESKIVKLTQFKLNIVTMIITVEDEDLNIQILKKEQENNMEDWKRIMKQQLLNQIRVMRNLLQTKNKNQLQHILIQYSQLLLLQQSKRNIVQVELTKLLSEIIREFRIRRIKLITYEAINIQTQRSKMLILLMQITKQLLKVNKLILIQFGQIEQNILMTIHISKPIQIKCKSNIIEKITNELVESVTFLNGSIQFYLYILEQIFSFYKIPHQSFN